MKLAGTAKGSHFEERLPPLRGKMSRSDKRGSVDANVVSRRRGRGCCPCTAFYMDICFTSGRVKIWFTTTSYSHGSRSFFSCFSSFSAPAKQWMR